MDEQKTNHIKELNMIKDNINIVVDNYVKQLELERNIQVVIQFINFLFDELWDDSILTNPSLNEINFNEIANNTPILSRKYSIRNNGVKYALSSLNGYITNKIVSYDLVIFYISLNDYYHPRIQPKKIIIAAIDEINNNINEINQNYKDKIHLSSNILEELRRYISIVID